MEQKKHLDWIDMAKGYGILAVILCHIVSKGLLHNWVYTFHIPLFFFLSGYVFSDKLGFGEFLKKKCRTILLPYFSLGLPMLAFHLWYKYHYESLSKEYVIKACSSFFLQNRYWTLWFLATLFVLNILFYITKKLLKRDLLMFIASAVLVALGLLYYKFLSKPLFWDIDAAFMAFPFFFGGYFLKTKRDSLEKYLDQKPLSIALFFAFGIINAVFFKLDKMVSGESLEMYSSKYGFAIFTYISAFAGVMAVIIFSKLFTLKPIAYIGKNSLIYFAWHQTIAMALISQYLKPDYFIERFDSFGNMIYYLVYLLLVLICCTIFVPIFNKTKLKYLIGKK